MTSALAEVRKPVPFDTALLDELMRASNGA
jgi:hypothetical protein